MIFGQPLTGVQKLLTESRSTVMKFQLHRAEVKYGI